MSRSLRTLASGLAATLLVAGCASAPPSSSPAAALRYWLPADDAWTSGRTKGLNLRRADSTAVRLDPEVVTHFLVAREQIEARSGLAARLAVVDLDAPNAFATTRGSELVVAVSLAWIRALGSDPDAIATTLGHEYAHHKLAHDPATRRTREQAAAAGGQLVGTLLNFVVPYSGNLANLAITGVARGFTRDEERAADELGLSWAVAAGYDPCGRIRTLEMYQRGAAGSAVTFLSTHPGVEERMAYARTVAAREGRRCAGS